MGAKLSYRIDLTDEESSLLEGIELDAEHVDHEVWKRRAPLVLKLMKSLRDRDAIPEVRKRYWSDPEFYLGRQQTSHKGAFERNGNTGKDIYTHPSFLKYLRYFLFGPQLPDAAISEFESIVGRPEWVTSGDLTHITKGTRVLVRKYGLQGSDEEFYRLALDVGLDQSFAKAVRDAAKQVGRGRSRLRDT